jgi:hypothetical protein
VSVADLYILSHRELGPLETFLTKRDANGALAAVVRDEPDWASDLTLELFDFVVQGDEPTPPP